uniref:Uncharacterized protein n=1 Tax=Rhizophora mucronata TaxID=61149 RepID=A0A2P2PRL4_RHIMU
MTQACLGHNETMLLLHPDSPLSLTLYLLQIPFTYLNWPQKQSSWGKKWGEILIFWNNNELIKTMNGILVQEEQSLGFWDRL